MFLKIFKFHKSIKSRKIGFLSAEVFFCEICKIFKNTYFVERMFHFLTYSVNNKSFSEKDNKQNDLFR